MLSPAQVVAAKGALDALPADMTVPSLLVWLHARIGTFRPEQLRLRAVPLLDQVRDPLDTLVRWQGFTGAQLVTELGSTLDRTASVVQVNTSGLLGKAFPSVVVGALSSDALAKAAGDLAGALEALEAAVTEPDNTTITDQLAIAQSAAIALEAANVSFDGQGAALESLVRSLRALPSDLETGICRLLVLTSPRASLSDLANELAPGVALLPDEAVAPITEVFGRVREFLENLLGLLDLGAVTQPIADVIEQGTAALEQLEQGVAQLTASARAVFEQAHEALGALDLDSIVEQAKVALEGAVQGVQQQLSQGLAPAVDALGAALGAVHDALDAFDPEALSQPIREAMDAIRGVFDSPEVQQIVEQLGRLTELAQKLDELSFAPVTDVVIDGIGEIKSALDSISGELSPPMPDMLKAAMSVLPQSLTPLTDSLLGDLDDLIEQGPIAVLEGLKELPKPIVEQLEQFSPRGLLEEPLGAPFRELRQKLGEFEPTHWLDVAEQELDALKQRLIDALDLGAMLAPLSQAFQKLLDELARFRPGAVLQPLIDKLKEAADAIVGALPTSEIVGALDQVLGRAHTFTHTLEQVVEIGQAFSDKFALLGDPEAELDAWVDEILSKLPSDAATTLAPRYQALAAAVEASRSLSLSQSYQAARSGLAAKLEGAGAPGLLSRLMLGRSRLTPALVQALPDSQAKTDLAAFLATLDPAGPTQSRGLRALSRLGDGLSAADTGVARVLVDWDTRYHPPGGALAELRQVSVTTDQLAASVKEAVSRSLGAPVTTLLKQLKSVAKLVAAFTGVVTGLVGAVSTKLNEALAVPEALSGMAHELQELTDSILGLDLELFRREIDSLYEDLLGRLRALDPRNLEQPLRDALAELLDVISLDAVVTPALRNELGALHAELVQKVDSLDPELLVIRPLDDLYREEILPVVEVIDVSEAVQVVIDRLNGLPDELKGELEKVDQAYRDMLNASPVGAPGGGASVSV